MTPILQLAGGASVGVNVYGKGIDEILERVAVGSAYYPQQNHEGSVMLLTNTSGNAIERYRYDAFGAPIVYDGSGNQRNPNNTIYDNRFLFTGREYAATYRATTTPAFNFYEYRARAYNPKLGRFMSEDPKLFDAGDYNLFRYCHNDPIDFTDPMGTEQNWTQTGAPISGNHVASEMAWEMTKWFDRSNILQGNFPGFAALSGQSDRDAKGGLTMAQTNVGAKQGNVFSRLSRSIGKLFGHHYSSRTTNEGPAGYPPIVRHGYLRIDTDGTGPAHGDPYHEPTTSYTRNGRSLNADTDSYIAVPTAAQNLGVRAGDRANATVSGRTVPGIVGDFGGTGYGEMSVHMVRDAGIGIHVDPIEGPVPNTRGGINPPVTIIIFPSSPPSP